MQNSIDRPNFGINSTDAAYSVLGDNNLRREFYDCFSILLSSCYEDDTLSARFLNKVEDDGRSSYYVVQSKIEDKLKMFMTSPGDDEKFLIGFTGIGKTTLLKNFFKLNKQDLYVSDDGILVAYLSVYSDIINTEKDLNLVFSSFLQTIIDELERHLQSESNEVDMMAFYQYVKAQKARYLKEAHFFKNTSMNFSDQLNSFEKNYPIDFLTMMMTYLLTQINQEKPIIRKVILLYDDIESIDAALHIPFISVAQKIYAKLKISSTSRSFAVKSLISLRNYTFRYNYARQADAMRDYSEDVILKDSIPNLKEIFEKRFHVYYDNPYVSATVKEDRWEKSVSTLKSVLYNMSNFGESISALANYDISHALKMLLRVLTNHRWFAPDEKYYLGAYELNSDDYLPIKDRTIRALAYGEETVFIDGPDNVLPNILHIHTEEKEGTELLSLYILEYMLVLQRSKSVTLYGQHKIAGNDLKGRIVNILHNVNPSLVEYSIEQLYKQRCLLRSIFEPETCSTADRHTSNRHYEGSFGLYLSFRGNKIMELLSRDSLLLEIFRDDIDTNISGNTIPSAEMSQREKMIYLINYCEQLFEREKEYIQVADKSRYFEAFGGSFIITRLVKGLQQSFFNYYRRIDEDYHEVSDALKELFSNIVIYRNHLQSIDSLLQINLDFMDEQLLVV